MVALPQYHKDLTYILNSGSKKPKYKTDFLGMSGVGAKCYRSIQYTWRRASQKEIPTQLQRIFDAGNYYEGKIVEELTSHGMTIVNDQAVVFGFAGCWKGKIDGEVTGVPAAPIVSHLLEIKTMNLKGYNAFVKHGLQVAHPKYYDQIQRYMDLRKKERGLLVAYCKDNSLYHTERIYPDYDRQRELAQKEADICMASDLFPRIGNNTPEWHECTFCDHKGVCFETVEVEHNCRTCKLSDIHNNNVWECTLKGETLDRNNQDGCKHYAKDEMFITVKDITTGKHK
jgi:hypothetical protein